MPVIIITVFAAAIPASIILPMLPFIGQKYGATSFEISLLFTLMPMLTIVCSPVWGKLSDKFGRKPVFLTSLGVTSLTFIFFGLANSLDAMFAARAFQGVTGGSFSIAFAMVADSTSHDNRAKYMGYTGGAMSLAFFVGPVLGGVFMGGSVEEFTHALPSFVAAGLGLFATLVGVIFLKETRKVPGRMRAEETVPIKTEEMPPQAHAVAEDSDPYVPPTAPIGRIALFLLIGQFLIGGYTGGSDQFVFAFWAQGLHAWGPDDVSYGMAGLGLGYMVATIGLIGPLVQRFADVGAYLVGSAMNVTGLAICLLAQDVWISYAGLWFAVVGAGVWNTVLSSVLTKVSPPDKIGFMLGISNGFNMFGRVCGPLIAGSFFLDISLKLPFTISLALVIIVCANAIRLVTVQRRAAARTNT